MNIIVSFALLGIALLVAYPILNKIGASQSDDRLGLNTFKRFAKEAGYLKTAVVYGGLFLAMVAYQFPVLVELFNK